MVKLFGAQVRPNEYIAEHQLVISSEKSLAVVDLNTGIMGIKTAFGVEFVKLESVPK